uniref:Sodium:proton antiporter n=1 Tax=Ignisphaera aggregans TaxID=334771 RepID=A0A7J3QFB3_9CREN
MNRKDIALGLSLAFMVLAISIVISIEGIGPIIPIDIRGLGASYLWNSYNPWNTTLTSFSLNAVTAIIWDYRGLDTFYETAVLFASIVAILMVLRGYIEVKGLGVKGLSDITKTATKIILPLIVTYGFATAVHGQITPGGGFQGGAIAVVASTLIIAVLSIEYIYELGISSSKLMLLRVFGFLGIIATSISLAIIGMLIGVDTYIFQNMAKENSLSMPINFLDTTLAGSIFIFNLFEFIIVFSGLTFALIMLTIREEELRNIDTVVEVYE